MRTKIIPQSAQKTGSVHRITPRVLTSARAVLRAGVDELIDAVQDGVLQLDQAAQLATFAPADQRTVLREMEGMTGRQRAALVRMLVARAEARS